MRKKILIAAIAGAILFILDTHLFLVLLPIPAFCGMVALGTYIVKSIWKGKEPKE